jgi:transposase-like protein
VIENINSFSSELTMSFLSALHFHDEAAAHAYVEARLWANGRYCPHCGVLGESKKLMGKSTRLGVYKCYGCRKLFTVKVGTIFESTHIKLHLWLQAIYLIASSKKGISSHQLHRTLGITVKSAWFLSHRIRASMKQGGFSMFGQGGGIVEVDETFIGNDKSIKPKGVKKGRGYAHKHKVLSLVDRTTGRAQSIVVDDLKTATLLPILQAHIAPEAKVMTDEASQYKTLPKHFAVHAYTVHSKGEYVSKIDRSIHTNTVEGFFSVFKRGMRGVYQHCAKHHLHRYVTEFDFRHSNRLALGVHDDERADRLLLNVVGKRLTYRPTGAGQSVTP